MVNWLLAGKDIGQARTRSLCDDVSQFTSENLQIMKCRREIANIFMCFILIFTSIEAKPLLLSWEVSECSCLLYSQSQTLGSCGNRPHSSQPAGGFGDVSQNNPHGAPKKLCSLCEVWPLRGVQRVRTEMSPKFLKNVAEKRNHYWAGNSIFRKYKHNSVSSNIKDPGHFFGMQELIVKGLRCDLCSFSWG